MAKPVTRVLAVLELLQAHARISGSELAERLGVDRRTVRRYIAALEELGIPITAERGRDGAYMLVPGFKLPPLMFSDDEALAIAVGLLAARGLGLSQTAPAAESAQAKLERVLPDSVRRRVRAVDETVALDLSRPPNKAGGTAAAPADSEALSSLAAAAQGRQRVHLRYGAPGQAVTERDFDAYGLVWLAGRWYAVGMCHLRGGVRSFRLDRILAVREPAGSPRRFVRPTGFDALAHLKLSLATLPRAFAAEVLLRTDLATARRELYPMLGVLEWTAEGVVLRSQADDLGWLAQELSRLPFEFQIRSPVALRRALAGHARRLLARSS